MKERLGRLRAIQKLIKNQHIDSQDALLSSLHKEGFTVTQATLSRDLKFLKVGKNSDGRGGYIYTLPGENEWQETERAYIRDFLRGYVSVECSGNMAVIKTYSGHCAAVALAVDALDLDGVLGTISGRDNTVFICLREGVTGEIFLRHLKEAIPGFKEKS